MADIRTWTPESDVLKPGEISGVQEIRSWFERLPRMRALIRQQQEHIESLVEKLGFFVCSVVNRSLTIWYFLGRIV